MGWLDFLKKDRWYRDDDGRLWCRCRRWRRISNNFYLTEPVHQQDCENCNGRGVPTIDPTDINLTDIKGVNLD